MNPIHVHSHDPVATWKVLVLVGMFLLIVVGDWYVNSRRPTGRSPRK